MRHNDSLKTANIILKELNKTFYVTKPFTKNNDGNDYDFLVYEAPDGGGLDFKFGVFVKKGNKKIVIFNGAEYTEVDKLLQDVEKYNLTLMFPSHLYDPNYRKDYINRARIAWYLDEVLKFEFSDHMWKHRGEVHQKKGVYNEEVTNIQFEVDENGSGTIYRSIGGSSWIEMKFETVVDAIKAINGILIPEVSVRVGDCIDLMEKISRYGLSLDNAEAIKVNYSTLEVLHMDFKKKAIEMMEEALKKLKAGQS